MTAIDKAEVENTGNCDINGIMALGKKDSAFSLSNGFVYQHSSVVIIHYLNIS